VGLLAWLAIVMAWLAWLVALWHENPDYICAEWIDPPFDVSIPFSRIPDSLSGYTRITSIPFNQSHSNADK
jgi:hypothetical protein